MSETQPHPWAYRQKPEADGRPISHWIDSAVGSPIADVYSLPTGAADPDARARLIAAAPELLDALRAARAQIEYLRGRLSPSRSRFTAPTTAESLRAIDSAISTATGSAT